MYFVVVSSTTLGFEPKYIRETERDLGWDLGSQYRCYWRSCEEEKRDDPPEGMYEAEILAFGTPFFLYIPRGIKDVCLKKMKHVLNKVIRH